MRDYGKIKELNEIAYNFITKEAANAPLGRHELGGGVYANIEEYQTKPRSAGRYEAHRRYIDIQYIILGEELITLAPLDQVVHSVLNPYDSGKDIAFYQRDDDGVDNYLTAGDFLIIGPATAHMPQIMVNGRQTVRKCVVKVPV